MSISPGSDIDETSRRILKAICEDGRITATDAAAKAGCSKPTVLNKMKSLEKELDLYYTVEFDQHRVGLEYRYLIAVKTSKQVDRKRLLQLLKRSDIPQFAAICEGDFNLLIYAAARKHIDYLRWMSFMRRSLQEDGNRLLFWRASHIALERLGSFSLSDGALKNLELTRPQKTVLRELNRNARMPLVELARKLGVSATAAKYHLANLLKNGYIRRFTAIIQKPLGGINVAFFIEKPFLPDHAKRAERSRELYYFGDGKSTTNRYFMVYELSGHSDQFNLANFGTIDEWYAEKMKTTEIFGEGTRVHSAIILEVLLGKLPVRNTDIKKIYDTAEWRFGKED